jgi:predicted ArsR family transcriptional regulator
VRLAAFHLDRLAEAGLLDVTFARPQGRTGPGAGRPAKRYAPAALDLELSVPPRRYNLVARLLAAAIDAAPTDARPEAARLAAAEGRRIGAPYRKKRHSRATALRAVQQALAAFGFEPRPESNALHLRNCPFHEVVDVAPTLVCPLNKQLVGGVIEGAGAEAQLQACGGGLAPECCVIVAPVSR